MVTPLDSFINNSKNMSVDFDNLPALLMPLEGDQRLTILPQDGTLTGDPTLANQPHHLQEQRPRFDYESRFFNHYNVNKMTIDN